MNFKHESDRTIARLEYLRSLRISELKILNQELIFGSHYSRRVWLEIKREMKRRQL